ncbi:hypothetical protein [Peribacillus deserti]|uniref:Uncharacterized protein n=1 Tax=Peribacillus deserti TaxID=673318 RepID=A0A2N5M0U6_9BACI|nr:hypothetical protein [Peribacillus deserti]PLT27986.1 hypothetical protein CUU66_21235 [Peribacillus deserti]
MNNAALKCISEMVFMENMHLFERPDVILYHPGHFPELNEQLVNYYRKYGAHLIMIPEVVNSFLNCSEYEFYAPLLIAEGIKGEKLMPIRTIKGLGVDRVIKSAFEFLNGSHHKNILLAGKSFFCRRFYLLASIYANDDKVIDILPLQDHREIVPYKWEQSEKGRARILNELEQYPKIIKKQMGFEWN